MRNVFLPLMLATMSLLAGCATRPSDAVGAGNPGRPIDVDHGIVDSSELGSGAPELRILPISHFTQPTFDDIKGPEIIHCWLPGRKSLDGLTWREGVWAHRVTRYYTWGQEDLMKRGSVSLKDASGFDEGSLTMSVRTDQVRIEPQPEMALLIKSAYGNNATPSKATQVEAPARPAKGTR